MGTTGTGTASAAPCPGPIIVTAIRTTPISAVSAPMAALLPVPAVAAAVVLDQHNAFVASAMGHVNVGLMAGESLAFAASAQQHHGENG